MLPGARVGPCLYAALRVLCANERTFESWSSIAGGQHHRSADSLPSLQGLSLLPAAAKSSQLSIMGHLGSEIIDAIQSA